MSTFMAQVVVMISWVYIDLQIHQVVYITYVQLLTYMSIISQLGGGCFFKDIGQA